MKNIQNIFYKISDTVKVCKPGEAFMFININEIVKIDTSIKISREEANRFAANIIIEDFCPSEFMFVEFTIDKIVEFKKRKDSNKIFTSQSCFKRFDIKQKD